ncbi:hypothetical protein [Liquorilactobacillus hordei]|uniref:hypothetical protein n=1 Tax=Liquorilactobacillus hordei TaxID=468911 RepID=UPI0039ECD330
MAIYQRNDLHWDLSWAEWDSPKRYKKETAYMGKSYSEDSDVLVDNSNTRTALSNAEGQHVHVQGLLSKAEHVEHNGKKYIRTFINYPITLINEGKVNETKVQNNHLNIFFDEKLGLELTSHLQETIRFNGVVESYHRSDESTTKSGFSIAFGIKPDGSYLNLGKELSQLDSDCVKPDSPITKALWTTGSAIFGILSAIDILKNDK